MERRAMTQNPVDEPSRTKALGYVLAALGILTAGAAVLKMSVIGFYPHDVPLLVIMSLVGGALLWAAEKLI